MKISITKSLLLAAICCSSLLCASQEKHALVGERPFPAVDNFKVLEKRALRAENNCDQEINEGEEKPLIPSDSMIAASQKAKAENQQNGSDAVSKIVKKSSHKDIYFTSHPGAFHKPYAVTVFGDEVQLEDGSIWNIYSGDRFLTLNWLTTDDIVITPNKNIFSIYPMVLTNQQTGASVQSGLAVGPVIGGFFSHWIIAIDKYNDQICLEDGSIWSMSPLDHDITKKWLAGDTVIIGINDGILSSIRPNILINVNVNNYAIGNCLAY